MGMIAQMSEKLTRFTGKMNEKADPFIGVLDIFGFEFYPDEQLLPDGGQVMNTLDQYNINMCNEVLQGEFVRCIFDLEQEIYQTQIHEIVPIDFDDNKDTIKLMKDNKVSIIKELDAQAASKKTGSAGDKGFHTGLERLIKTDKYRVLAPEIADVKPVKSGAKALADHIEGLVPHIIQEMAEKPPEKQRNDGIRVGTPKVNKGPPLVLMRDWLARDLGEKVKKILSSSGVVAQAAVRMGMERHNYARMKSARDLQSSLRAVALCKPFFATRGMTSRLIPEARLVLAHSTASKATELNHSHESRKSMKTFQEDNKDLVIAEAKERRQAKQEDDYARLVLEARQMEQIDELKANYIRKAQEAHSMARALFHETNDVVEAQASQIAAKDAEWSKISSNGVVRSVPQVRKYKASAQPFNPPASYKFSYKFTYKGTSEVAEE